MCSSTWATLPVEQKARWQDEALKAKEAHERMYPDYKYNPRKPGEKKKRQSRKSMKAAANAATLNHAGPSTAMSEREIFDFNSFPDNVVFSSGSTTASESAALTLDMPNINNILSSDVLQPVQTMPVQTPVARASMPAVQLYYAETLRQERLEAEFGNVFNAYDAGQDGFAFRDGAEEDATLAPTFSDPYNI